MIFIQLHQDTDLSHLNNNIINKSNFKIISTSLYKPLQNDYEFDIVYEYPIDEDIFINHNLYGDLTYKYFVWKNIDKFNNDGYIGFIQSYRLFRYEILNKYHILMNIYDIIIHTYGKYPYFLNNTLYEHHSYNLHNDTASLCLYELINIIIKYFDEYREIAKMFINDNITDLLPKYKNYISFHNIFIMNVDDFKKYCEFIFGILDIYVKQFGHIESYNNFYSMRIYANCIELINNIFFYKNYNNILGSEFCLG